MLRTILRIKGDGVGWAWIVDEVDDLFDPPLIHGRYRAAAAVRCIVRPVVAVAVGWGIDGSGGRSGLRESVRRLEGRE